MRDKTPWMCERQSPMLVKRKKMPEWQAPKKVTKRVTKLSILVPKLVMIPSGKAPATFFALPWKRMFF